MARDGPPALSFLIREIREIRGQILTPTSNNRKRGTDHGFHGLHGWGKEIPGFQGRTTEFFIREEEPNDLEDRHGTGGNRGNGGTEAWGGIKPNSTVRSVASVNARRYMSRSYPTPMKPCKIGYSSIPVVHLPGMRRGFSGFFRRFPGIFNWSF